MLILHFVYNYWSYSGATEQAGKLANSLKTNHDVRSVFLNNSVNKLKWYKISEEDGFDIIDLPCNLVLKFLCLIILHFRFLPDAYHLHGFHRIGIFFTAIINAPSLFKCTLLGKDDLPSLLSSKMAFINRLLIKRITKINCLNKVIYDLNIPHIPQNKLEIIPNGVVTKNIAVSHSIRHLFLFAGAVVPRKRPLEVIRFFNDNYNKNGCELILAGPCDDCVAEFDIAYFEECVKEASRVDSSAIKFVGNLSQAHLTDYYSKALGLIFFSLREGTPNVVLEAMSHNCPIIFSNHDIVVSHLLGNELTEVLSVDLSKPKIISISLLSRLSLSGSISERANLFNIEKTAARHYEVYKKCIY